MLSHDGFTPVLKGKSKQANRLLHDSGFKQVPTPADGHCLIHAFLLSWALQIVSIPCSTYDDVKSRIFLEAISKRDIYIPFTCFNITSFAVSMKEYLLLKCYNSSFCDVIPLMLANIFNVNIIIIQENAWHFEDIEIQPFSGRSANSIYMYKSSALDLTEAAKQCPQYEPKHAIRTSNKFSALSKEDSYFESNEYKESFPLPSKPVPKNTKSHGKKKTKNTCHGAKQAAHSNEAIIIGSSQVRDVSQALNRRKYVTLSYTNAGCQISHILNRLKDMIPENYKGKIILQIGGNDCASHNTETVLYRFQEMISLLKKHAPFCNLIISEIPPRFKDEYTHFKIREVNQSLHHMSLFSEEFTFLNNPEFSSVHFKSDGVHLNKAGFNLYINNIIKQGFRLITITNFKT
jgi:hypothetical protein